MKWSEIREKNPNKFILIGDIVEEPISGTKVRVLEAKMLEASNSPQEIRKAYQDYKKKGMEVLYCLPNTPNEFIIEDVPFMGCLK